MTRVAFLGSKQLGLDCLKTIHEITPSTIVGVVTIDDSHDRRSVLADLREYTEQIDRPFAIAANRRESESLICRLQPDICLVVGWYWLISPATLTQVPRGFLGLHNSLLPRYRGAAPLVWAMIHGEAQVGFSLFTLTEGMDDGPIWGQRSVPVEQYDCIADVLAKLEREAVAFLREKWPLILAEKLQPIPQDSTLATYCAARKPQDGCIDWQRPARHIYNFIRAQSFPYPGAFTYLDNSRKLTIWRSQFVEERYFGTPGQVARIREDGVYVICGDHRPLLVQKVSVDGSDELAAPDVLASCEIRLDKK